MKRKCFFRKGWVLVVLLMLALTAQAQLKDGHFFMSLENENVAVEHAEKYFSQWFSLPAGTEWQLVGSSIDQLGMSRIEYRQYVNGIEVEHSQILLHARNGKVETVNGAVMEQHRMPQPIDKVRRSALTSKDGKLVDGQGREVYLIDTKDGYRYAYKERSEEKMEWIYTDVETGEKLMSIPMYKCLTKPTGTAAKAKGKRIYGADVDLDVTKTSDGKTWLYDQGRNIHTVLGAYLPTKADADETEFAADDDKKDYTKYLLESNFASYVGSDNDNYSAYKATKLTILTMSQYDEMEEKYSDITEFPVRVDVTFRYGLAQSGKASGGAIEETQFKVDKIPFEIDLSKFQEVIPREGFTIILKATEWDKDNGYTFSFKPDASGSYAFAETCVAGTLTYEASGDPVADIHWGMGKTYDFYKQVFNRNSYDDKGSAIYNFVYLPDDENFYPVACPLNNATALSAHKPYPMVYGLGGWGDIGDSAPAMLPVVEQSVLSHEFTHIVTERTAGLVYQGESGALDESFSDLMGISCKKWVEGDKEAGWLIGDKGLMYGKSNMRDIANPKNSEDGKKPHPDTYKGKHWVDPTDLLDDNGGVHLNSGVQNKWFYLLTDGGKGTNDNNYSYEVTGVGIEKSRQIAYRTLTTYATKTSQYADIRKASIQAAKDLYKEGAEVEAVKKAWDAVGVYENGTAPTGISQIATEKSDDNKYYDLQGRPVSQPSHGVYIHQGKKVIKH
ncbi:MAG: M4 family metallopeptidase [Prevotella sp.]|nr:M4 family metallopeptidase [Prevotella sp.]